MHVGGLQKNSFIDYPNKMSCVIFLSGCNFHCPYCHNPSLVGNKARTSPPVFNDGYVFNFLKTHKSFLDGVVISGGEPTCQKDIFLLCERIKKLNYPIKLDTNGSNPAIIQQLIQTGLIDYVAMDIKTHPDNYSPILMDVDSSQSIYQSIEIIMKSSVSYEFRTTCLSPFIDEIILKDILNLIHGASTYVLQRYHNATILNDDYIKNHTSVIQDDQLMQFQSMANQKVAHCFVR
ncbi:MAG: anaerobic ribonucleoside-triphosphate reductase activating protein [Desulfobacterales bacterium]|nr:anaerobic ribonucleoside-triphosphate reductase activating protein [Desulfobacterales bacterium]